MKSWQSLLILIPSLLLAQVNTVKMRNDEKKGLSGNISVGYNMAMGNSEFLNFSPSVRIDYNTENYTNFITASYNRKQSKLDKNEDNLLAHKGFTHIRSVRSYSNLYSWELFGQWEFNEFINLENRLLVGTGARLDLTSDIFSTFDISLGIGGMYEIEEYIADKDKELWRSTNYLKIDWGLSDYASINLTSYFQFALSEPKDYRVLSEGELKINLSSCIIFGTSVNLRYDNDPSFDVKKKYDVELGNNFTIAF